MPQQISFEVLPGLPTQGEWPINFDKNPTGSEGVVVRFVPGDGKAWVGNFLGGLGGLNEAFEHPNGHDVLVIAAGDVYVVDPETRELKEKHGSAFRYVFNIPEKRLIILGSFTEFCAYGEQGLLWESERISWDDFKDLSVKGHILSGKAWRLGDEWTPFTFNIETGTHTGGGLVE